MAQIFNGEQESNVSFFVDEEHNHKFIKQQNEVHHISPNHKKNNKPKLKQTQYIKHQNKEFYPKKPIKYVEKIEHDKNQQVVYKKTTVQSIEYNKKHYKQKINNIPLNHLDNQINFKQPQPQVQTDLVLLQHQLPHQQNQWNQSTSFQNKQQISLQTHISRKNNKILYVEKTKDLKKQNQYQSNSNINNQNRMVLINHVQPPYTNQVSNDLNFTINRSPENSLDLSIVIPNQQSTFKIIHVNIQKDQDTQKSHSFSKMQDSINNETEQDRKSSIFNNQEQLFEQENKNDLLLDLEKIEKEPEQSKQLLRTKKIYLHVKFRNILELSILKIMIGKQQQKLLCKKLYLNQIQRNPLENSTIPLQINCYERKFTSFYLCEDEWLFGKSTQKIQFEEIKLKCSDCKKYLKILGDSKGCRCPHCSTVIECQIQVKQQYDLY